MVWLRAQQLGIEHYRIPESSVRGAIVAGRPASQYRNSGLFAELGQTLGDLDLQATRDRLVEHRALQAIRQELLARGVGARLVVVIAVAIAVAEFLHQLGRCFA